MGFDRAIRAPGGARTWLAATLVAAVILLVVVAPVAAERGPVRLADPSVSPVQVTAGQRVTFSVLYSNGQGNGPASIVVKVGSTRYPMSAPAGTTNFGGGVTYTAVAAPPAGTWPVEFIATDKFGNTATLAGATLSVIAPPQPTPKPTPTPTPTPTPRPTPTPGGSPVPTATPGSGSGSPGSGGTAPGGITGSGGSSGGGGTSGGDGSGGGPGSGGSGAGAGAPQLDDGLPPSRGSTRGWWSVATDVAGAGAVGGSGIGGAVGTPRGDDWKIDDRRTSGTSGSSASGGSISPSLAASLGLEGGGLPIGQMLTTAIVSLGGVAMAMSFMLFGRRRRDDDPTDTDEALAAAAAMGPGAVGTGALVAATVRRAPVAVAQPDAELDLPRWRRPSLLAARKEDPLRAVHSDVKLTFDAGAVAPIDGVERRLIRYRLVRLLDAPDEVVAGEIGFLDEGDEVQLLRRSGLYWLVLCPDGRQGWVHRMVLGDVVADEGADGGSAEPSEPERGASFLGGAGIRLASDGDAAWSLRGAGATDAGMDVDEDVLRAYLASRGRI